MQFIYILLFAWFHPFYVSVTTLEQSKDKSSIEITSRIFYDDLEAALKDEFGGKVDLKNTQQTEKNNGLIKRYFEKKFLLKINDNPSKAEYLGFTIEGETAWCFLEVKIKEPVKKVEISNKTLYNSFKEQINIFHLNINGIKKSTKLQNPESIAKFVIF